MPTTYIARTSASIAMILPDAPRITLYLTYDGTPDKVKEAMRKACSHRRTIVVARTEEFIWNVVCQLGRLIPQDCGSLWTARPPKRPCYRYEIGLSGKTPVITWYAEGYTPLTEPLFRWLGYEWRRPTKPRAPRTGKAKGGRPSGFRKRHPELFALPDNTAVAQNGDTLGLKDKRRIKVDRDALRTTFIPKGIPLKQLEQWAKENDELEGVEK